MVPDPGSARFLVSQPSQLKKKKREKNDDDRDVCAESSVGGRYDTQTTDLQRTRELRVQSDVMLNM